MKRIINDLLYDTDTSTLIYTDIDTQRKYYMTDTPNYFCTFSNGTIEPMTERAIKDLLGVVDVDKYIELFDTPTKA